MRRVCFDIPDVAEYRQAFWGHVWELGQWYNWDNEGVDEETAIAAAEYWTQVLNVTSERWHAQLDCLDDGGCVEYDNTAPFIQYFPNDPRYTPDLVPEGYNSPPWYFATAASNVAYGTQDGDIVTSLDRFPPGSLPTIIPASGLPRCRINVNFGSAGTVRVYLRNMVAGSLIQSTVDDDILTLNFFDVTKDLLSVPAETGQEVIYEHTFETPGQHHIDLIVVSMVNDQIPFLFHGGAVFKVEICGGLPVVPTITDIRLTGCGLEVQYDGQPEWELVGQVMTPTADCDFTEEVTIDRSDNVDAQTAITMKNSGANAGSYNGVQQRYIGIDSAGAEQSIALLRGKWFDAGVNYAGFGFYTRWADALRSILEIGSNWSMRMYIDDTFGRNNGLVFWRSANPVGYNPMLRVQNTNPSDSTWTLYDNGYQDTHRLTDVANGFTPTAIWRNKALPGTTPANGFGMSFIWQADTSVQEQKLGRLTPFWADATDATRSPQLDFRLRDYALETIPLSLGSAGGQSKLGVHGKTPQLQPVVTGDDTNETLTSLLAALDAVGYIDNQGAVATPVAVTTGIESALGDRNLPPDSVISTCKAANWVAGELYAHIATAFSVTNFSVQYIYDTFRVATHGFDLIDLYLFAQAVYDQTSLGGPAILAEIAGDYAHLVPALSTYLYDPEGLADWAAAYSGYGAGTKAVLPTLIRAFTMPTWKELVYTGALFGVENYSCSNCPGGSPIEGEWAIEWDAPGSDWTAPGCGTGWDFELFCGGWSFALDARLPVASAGTVKWDRVEVQIAYVFDDTRSIHSSLSNGASSRSGPTLTLEDTETTETIVISGIADFTSENGGHLEIRLGTDASPGPGLGEAISISHIRIEGSLEIPNNNGLEC